jgi:hypothetical protein
MNDTTTDTPTFSDNWGHFYWMGPLILLGTLTVDRWEAAPVFIVTELMYFALHTRVEHPKHPIQQGSGPTIAMCIIAACIWLVLPTMWLRMNPSDLILGSDIKGMMDRVCTFFTAYSLHLLSEFIHDVRHGNVSRAYKAYRANGEPAALYFTLRVGIPIGAVAYIGFVREVVLSANP